MRCRDAVTISTTKTTSDYDGGVGKRLLLLIQLESNSFLSHYLRSLGYAGEELTLSFLPPYELQSQNEKCPHYGLNLDKIHFHQKNMLFCFGQFNFNGLSKNVFSSFKRRKKDIIKNDFGIRKHLFFSLLNKNWRLRESCCYCKMQPCAKKRLSTRRAFTYFYKVSFFPKTHFSFPYFAFLRLLRAMHALELLISRRRGRRPSF